MTSTLDQMVGDVLLFRDRSHQMTTHSSVIELLPADLGDVSLLDVGCGWGDFSARLPETTRYLGIDVRPEVIEVARGAYRDREFRVTKKITPADIIVAIASLADGVMDPGAMVVQMWRKAAKAVVFTVNSAWVHQKHSEEILRAWCPQEPNVCDRCDDFFRVAMYK